jgi:hypothetical protein
MAAKHSAVGVIGMVLSAVGVILLILSVYSMVAGNEGGQKGTGGSAIGETTVPAVATPGATTAPAGTSDTSAKGNRMVLGGGAVLLVLGLILCVVGKPKGEAAGAAAK